MKLTRGDKIWLWIRVSVLPLIFIVPFFTNHFYQFPCPNPDEFSGPCYSIGDSMWNQQLGFISLILGFMVLFAAFKTWQRGRGKVEFAKLQLRYAIYSVIFTVIVYAVMYQFSEGRFLQLLEGSEAPTQSVLQRVEAPLFGVSFPPAFLAVFSTIYLLNPLLIWHKYTRDKARVAGIKKSELFQ